ncbi:E1-E2 ATPase family protein [Mycobacterium ulcerans str. Harvey]|uniref:E1-E2 ATPase family protein n=1 Tax=Mycobacterium ulcerans str. Harvey TaxID=1299332 RepID=A0ABN0QX11_MYCUL|nr:E1-E2 ATPase family protein [Mycobacterium ulcerans str. Harvey]
MASAVTLVVAAVPEGLTLVVTLAQLAAARRLTGESVLIRNAHSIEALARLNVVCFDKTGTPSDNRLKVKTVRPAPGFTPGQVLDAALSTTYSRHTHRVEHATDDAIFQAADDPAVRGDGSQPQPRPSRDAFLPFQSGRPFAAALAGTRLTIKGSPEVLSAALRRAPRPPRTPSPSRSTRWPPVACGCWRWPSVSCAPSKPPRPPPIPICWNPCASPNSRRSVCWAWPTLPGRRPSPCSMGSPTAISGSA